MIKRFLQKNKKIIKIFIIVFLFCYILKRFQTNYEYFEVCQNKCEIACDGLSISSECQSACDSLSDQGCTFKSNDATMDFGCYFNYQEEDITYTIDSTNQYGMLSCNDGQNQGPLINPKCSVGTLALKQGVSYTEYSDIDNPIASCPIVTIDVTGEITASGDLVYSADSITCANAADGTEITYRGTEKEVWDQIYYNGNRNLLEYRKPTCVVKNTGFLDQDTINICSSVNDDNHLLTSDICEGRGSNLQDPDETDPDMATRAEKCAWIPPTGQYGKIENDYYICQGTCTETATPSVEVDATACATVVNLNTPEQCEQVMTEADANVRACTYTPGSTVDNYILPKCYSFNDDCLTSYSTSDHETECEAIFGCNYEKKNTCFENTDTDNIECNTGYKRKVNPPPTDGVPSEDLHTHCCEPRINYCTNNLNSSNDIICEDGFIINDPENDKKPDNQDATTEEIQNQCCISSNVLRISVNIKDNDANGGFTISTVNNDRETIENNFKLDMIDIINNKLDFTIDPLFETSEIEIVSIETDLMLNCVKFIFDINRDGLDDSTRDTIKTSFKQYLNDSQNLENLNQSTLPPIVTVRNVPVSNTDSDKIYGYPSEYVYGGIGLFVFSSICSCCLFLLILLI